MKHIDHTQLHSAKKKIVNPKPVLFMHAQSFGLQHLLSKGISTVKYYGVCITAKYC